MTDSRKSHACPGHAREARAVDRMQAQVATAAALGTVECLMPSADAHRAALTAHSSTPSDVIRSLDVRGLEVRVRSLESGVLALEYVLDADMSRVRVPPSGPGRRTDGLWKHTCFEAFIVAGASPGYYELNFSPSKEWAVYRFAAYRQGMSPADVGQFPEISVRRSEHRLQLDAFIRLPDFVAPAGRLQLALAAVLEDEHGRLSCWALKHAPGKPDFHHPDGFTLEL